MTFFTISTKTPGFRTESAPLDGIEIVALPGGLSRHDTLFHFLRAPLVMREWKRRGPFQLVHAFQAPLPPMGAAALRAAQIGRLPALVDWDRAFAEPTTWRDAPLPGLARAGVAPLEKRGATVARAVTVVSETLEERARSLGVAAERIHRIPNGADTSATPRDRLACRKTLGLPAEAPLLAYQASESDAPEIVLRAFRDLSPSHAGLSLVCLGSPTSTPASQELLSWARQQPTFKVLPSPDREQTLTAYGAADILLLPLADAPAGQAAFPLCFGEYLAAGRAVVAGEVGEVGRIARESLAAVLAQTREQFNRRIEELLGNPERRQRLEQLARHTAETLLSWEYRGEELDALYQSVASKKR